MIFISQTLFVVIKHPLFHQFNDPHNLNDVKKCVLWIFMSVAASWMYLKSNLTLTVSQSSSHSRFCGCLMYLDFMLPDHQPLSLPAGLNLSLQYLPLLLARLIPVIAPHCILLWFTRHGSLMYGRNPKEAGRSPRRRRLPVSSCFLYQPPTSL